MRLTASLSVRADTIRRSGTRSAWAATSREELDCRLVGPVDVFGGEGQGLMAPERTEQREERIVEPPPPDLGIDIVTVPGVRQQADQHRGVLRGPSPANICSRRAGVSPSPAPSSANFVSRLITGSYGEPDRKDTPCR